MKFIKKQSISAWQVFARLSLVFTVFFVLLFSVFASAAKLPVVKKVVKPTLAVGSVYSTTLSNNVTNQLKQVEICRGTIKRTCKVLAKNVRGIKVSALIPKNYSLGDASIKITYKDSNKKTILVMNKAVKIVKASTNTGGGNGGGGGGSSSSSSSSSSSTSGTADDIDFGGSSTSTTPTPNSTPTPSGSTYKDVKPVLVSH